MKAQKFAFYSLQKQVILIFLLIFITHTAWGLDTNPKEISAAGSSSVEKPVRIGVLSFRPKPQTLAQWKPLEAALKEAIPEHDFVVEAFTYHEMNMAVAGRKIDFILTNPGHYVFQKMRNELSSPLATLVADESGHPSAYFGGVIFTRANEAKINTLADIAGKRVALTDLFSLGGYQMQLYELSEAKIHLSEDALYATGMPHDKVIEAVLTGKADVGFVRSGVLEGMVRAGNLNLKQVKIINRQNLPQFPVAVSTRLYPEWPFAALSHTDDTLAQHVTAALYLLERKPERVHGMKIHGFNVPADYTPVEEMLRELRLPPFDTEPQVSMEDIWSHYHSELIAAISAVVVLLFFGLIRLLKINRRLTESQSNLKAIIENEPECIKILDEQGLLIQMNKAGLTMIEADSMDEVAGSPVFDIIAPEYRAAYADLHKRVIEGETMQMSYEVIGLHGTRRWLQTHAIPIQHEGQTVHLAFTRDITEYKKREERLLLAASVFTHSPEGIIFADEEGKIIDVNNAFMDITGYSRDEVLGKTPRILKSDRHDKEFYTAMWHDLSENGHWSGKIWNQRKNGDVYAEMLTINAVRDEQGALRHYVALFSDISGNKG